MGGSRPRDSQQSKVFKAERSLNTPSISTTQINQLADRITRSQWWAKQDMGHIERLDVTTGATLCLASSWNRSGSVDVPLRAEDHTVIGFLHCVAHIIHAKQNDYTQVQLHGPEFTKTMLECVRRWGGGEDAKRELLAAYSLERAKTRVYTPEGKEALKNQAAINRSVFVKDDLRALLDELK